MYVVIVEHAIHPVEAVGPFTHMEDAEIWARGNAKGYIWRTAALIAPDVFAPNKIPGEHNNG